MTKKARQLGSVDLVTIHGALLALKEIAESYRQLGPSRDGVRREVSIPVLTCHFISSQWMSQIFICISHIPESLILAPRNEQLLGATCSLIAASMTQEDVDLQDGTSVPYWQKLVDHGLRNRGTDAQEEAAAAMATVSSFIDCSSTIERYVTLHTFCHSTLMCDPLYINQRIQTWFTIDATESRIFARRP